MSTDQKPVPASVNMDARNFLRAINNSAQSKVTFFESVVARLGKEAKKDFRLTALHPASLIFEDIKTHEYYTGDIKKDGPRYQVDNIKRINIVEEKKADLFDKNCSDMVDAIAEQDFKSAEKAFGKIELQRFRSRVIPESGWITTRDGEARCIKVQREVVGEDHIPQIIKAFTNAVSDSVELVDGQVVRGTFTETGETFTIPVDELTRRRIVARRMRQVAENAYRSPAFQKLVANVAALVSEQKIAEAVEVAAKFLREEQEFCLLNRNGVHSLVESALAAQMEFNSFLVDDVTTLMHKTNLKINRDSIVESWSKTAQKAQNAEMLSKAKALAESKDFAADYELFLEGVFNEANDIDSTRAKAYLVSLKVVKNVLKHVEGKEQLVQDIDRMVTALETDEPSTDVIYQTEELLAGISDDIVDRIQTMDSFDRMPGVDEGPEAPEAEAEEGGAPVPLPELGGEEAEGDMAGAPAMAGAEVGAGAGAAGAEPVPAAVGAAAESKKKTKEPISESEFTPIEKMSVVELQEELLSWKTDGHIYLKEDGFEDCFAQLNRYVDRCSVLGTSAVPLREEFEKIREVVIDSGNDVSIDLPDDPYAGKVELKEGTKIKEGYTPVSEDLGGLSAPAKGVKHSGDASGMSELQGASGLAKSGLKKVSGDDADGAPNPGGAAGGDLDMAKEHQGKTKGLADKGLKKVSGADAAGAPNPGGAAGGDLDMAKELQNKTKSIAEESVVDRIAAALDEPMSEEDLKVGSKYEKGGGYDKSHDLDMDELQGKDGVVDDKMTKSDGKGPAGVPAQKAGAPKNDADMAKDHQDGSDGVAESEEDADNVVAEVPPGEGEPATGEDQRKGPRMHQSGRKKAALAPREVKESTDSGKSVTEDVAVAYSSDERMEEVIARVIEAMAGSEGGDMAVPPMMEPPAMEPAAMPPMPELPAPEEAAEEPEAEEAEAEKPEELPESKEKVFKDNLGNKLQTLGEEAPCMKCKKAECVCPCEACGKEKCECK